MDKKCPRCGSTEFLDLDCGPDTWDDDVTYISYKCEKCGLWYDGWHNKWYINVDSWQEVEEAEEYKPNQQSKVIINKKLKEK